MAKLKREQIRALVANAIGRNESLEFITTNIFGSKLCDEIWELFDAYLSVVTDQINDTNNFLSWFIYDNESGLGKKQATPNAKKYPLRCIQTIDDLVWLIEESK